jgi:hypothetical protein
MENHFPKIINHLSRRVYRLDPFGMVVFFNKVFFHGFPVLAKQGFDPSRLTSPF